MSSKAIKPIIYSSIEEKNILEREMFKPLSSTDSLIQALDMMDLFASMRERPHYPEDDQYPWIILKFKK
ncbi:MAG TPA: hypothetical protein VL728_17935 [Cyclobacteriaceae bacterium]|jgi:hypothetical protein|nr:hypothetical protein [Cyclobacteriaceae bacterium]